jgi:serine/threonine protein kinase
MARLSVMGDYHGPGERRTAEVLAHDLPEHWVVVAGRSLPTPQRDDMDLVVIGDRVIFVVEEKSWGPRLAMGDRFWIVNGEERPNPLDRVSHVARVLAGVLREKVSGFALAAGRQHLVRAAVVLSHKALLIDGGDVQREGVMQLGTTGERLEAMDVAGAAGLMTVRSPVIAFLEGLADRPELPERIGAYTIEQRMAPIGRVDCFFAHDDIGAPVFLRCYPLDGWGPDFDPTDLIRRERVASDRLAEVDRAWRTYPAFPFEARRWMVVPVAPASGMSLRTSVRKDLPKREDGRLPVETMVDVVRDAFVGLAEVHDAGLVHRGIHPGRIFLGRRNRVKFADFYLARALGQGTIAPAITDLNDVSAPFRAPECRQIIELAAPASDVYALAFSLAWWIDGTGQQPDLERFRRLLSVVPLVGKMLASCLADAAKDRPTAHDVADALAEPTMVKPPAADEAVEFRIGSLIGERYELMQELGVGATARSWLVRDHNADMRRVLKAFHDGQTAERVREEFRAADELHHERCARMYDVQLTPTPGYLIAEYVEGRNLREFAAEPVDESETYRQIALDALSALQYLHSNGRLHRDVSPGNIIVTPDSRAKLIDFGLIASTATPHDVVGTLPYIAPEAWAGGPPDERSDLYSLAVSLLHVMLGRYPYAGDPLTGSENRHDLLPLAHEERSVWDAAGRGIIDVLFRAAAPDPAMRPASAEAFAEALQRANDTSALSGEPRVNSTVDQLRRLYRGSSIGNAGNRGLDDDFAVETYVSTLLDDVLLPRILDGKLRLVVLTGNPGDGKTSFLVKAGDALRERGARVIEDDAAGWRLDLDGHTFAAVYDASEAREGKSSDDLVTQALDVRAGESSDQHTALLAVNDGRLLQFFRDYSDIYPEYAEEVGRQLAGGRALDDRVAIVDLKRRTMAPVDAGEAGLVGRVLRLFVAQERWAVCDGCSSREVCPMRSNATLLRGAGEESLGELVLASHLRRRRRATFRDVRSALGWLVTGDRGCADVHAAREDGQDLLRASSSRVSDLAFEEGCQDYLVQEWVDLDPARVAAPAVERAARSRGALAATQIGEQDETGRLQRLLFFGGWSAPGVERESVRAYRYLGEYVAALASDEGALDAVPRLLFGLSKLLGAPGYGGSDMAVGSGEAESWSVIREVPASEFRLQRSAVASPYIESRADYLTLEHDGGATLPVTLDVAEMILRAADGEIFGDAPSEALRLELERLAVELRRRPARAVTIVDPSGSASFASLDGATIRLEPAR